MNTILNNNNYNNNNNNYEKKEKKEKKKIGLFGLNNLINSNDFFILSKNAINNCKILQNEIYNIKEKEKPKETLYKLDQISNEVCTVIDAAEMCRNSHYNENFRSAAEESFNTLAIFINELNSDVKIYEKIRDIVRDDNIWTKLTPEEQRFGLDMLLEYEMEGIHIQDPIIRQQIVDIQNELIPLESTYLSNISQSESYSYSSSPELTFPIGPLPSHLVTPLANWLTSQGIQQKYIPEYHKKYLSYLSLNSSNLSSTIFLSSNKRVIHGLLTYFSSNKQREACYSRLSTIPMENSVLLSKIILLRHKLAQLFGFSNYCEKILPRKVLKDSKIVLDLLESVSESTKSITSKEIEKLVQIKKEIEMNSDNFNPWDITYTAGIYDEKEKQLKNSSQKIERNEQISEYFEFNTCLKGLKYVCKSLFNIIIKREQIESTEGWVDNLNDIFKFNLYYDSNYESNGNGDNNSVSLDDIDNNEVDVSKFQLLGTIYLDPFSRDYKFSGASHFTIRCGISNESEENNKVLLSDSQLPIVGLLFNFGRDKNNQLFLTPNQLETLYHEWGHALHSLLSRTKFQHLSGTRGSTDFVEVPSHLFEYFARDPNVIVKWAKHHQTNQSPSLKLLSDSLSTTKDFAGIEYQTQILYAVIDQYMYGSNLINSIDLSSYPSSNEEYNQEIEYQTYQKLMESIGYLQEKYTSLPVGETNLNNPYYNKYPLSIKLQQKFKEDENKKIQIGNIQLLNHTHLVTYGGTYYSYIFARLYAAQIWNEQFRNDPLSRISGMKLWNNMLKYGAAKDPINILEDIGNGKLNSKYFLDTL